VDTVVVEQFVPAPPGAAQAAFLDAGELARWWWLHLPAVGYDVDGDEVLERLGRLV
jgi:hypothetical protein